MSMVFGVTAEADGLHDANSRKANDAFSHIDQHEPEDKQPATGSGITRKLQDRMAVIQRQTNKHIIEQVTVPAGGSAAGQPGGAVKILGSQKGRQWVMLQCPTGAPASVVISHNSDTLEETTPNGWVLPAGGQPIMLYTEAAIYAISATVGTATTLNVASGWYRPDEF